MGKLQHRAIEAYQQEMRRNEVTGLLKTTQTPRESGGSADTAADGDSKHRRVAKFLILIGGDRAAEILADLEPEQVEAVSREIVSIGGISREEGDAVLAEFRALFSQPYVCSGSSSGGVETARRILYTALGPEKGETLLNRAVPDSKENIFGFLEEFAPEQLSLLLKNESPATAALIFSRLPSALTAASLNHFPHERKLDIVKKIARNGQVSPEVLEQVAFGIREKVRYMGRVETREIDGMRTLAAILKQGDFSFGDRIISELETEDPDIGKTLKEQLHTLDDVLLALDRPLAEKLASMSDSDIAILLKGRGKDFNDKILSCVSAGRRSLIREEGEILGAVPKRDCDEAARKFLEWFRQARENGTVILSSDEDVFV